MRPLGGELLIVSLSPDEGRNTRAHPGIRAALSAALVLDSWVAGRSPASCTGKSATTMTSRINGGSSVWRLAG